MPNELELRQNGIGGLVGDNPLTAAATTLTSAALAAMNAVTSTSFMWGIIDPDGVGGAPEHIKFTLHTAGATTATILRGQNGTTARQHAQNTDWIHGPLAHQYKSDWTQVFTESGVSLTNWTSIVGTWASDGTVITQSALTAAYQSLRYTADIGGLGSILEAEIRFPSAGQATTGVLYGVLSPAWNGTSADFNNTYSVRLQRPALNTAGSVDFLTGGAVVSPGIARTVNLDQWYKLRIVELGQRVIIFLDGDQLLLFITTPGQRQGQYMGIGTYGAKVDFRNIRAWKPNMELPV